MLSDLNEKRSAWKQTLLMVGVCLAGIIAGVILRELHAPEETIVLIYILSVVVVSVLTSSYIYGVITSLISTFAYNFFQTEPYFRVSNFSYYNLLTFGLMMFLSILICFITQKVKQGEIEARKKEEESSILYKLTSDLAKAENIQQAIELTLYNVGQTFGTNCRMLLFDAQGKPETTFIRYADGKILTNQPTSTLRDFSEYQTTPPDGYYKNAQQYEWPAGLAEGKPIAALAIPVDTCEEMSESDFRLVSTMTQAAGIVISKLNLILSQEKNRQEVSQERYRSNLLRSISHDLRTPLAGISGTAELLVTLLEPGTQAHYLAGNIQKETAWLFSLVQNILSLTRLQEGRLKIKKEIEVVEDVADAAIETMKVRLPERTIVKKAPDDILIAPMDSSLIKQVIINLLDNGNKYSSPKGKLEVVIADNPAENSIDISVLDEGDGISPEALDKIFKMFYTTRAKAPESMRGFGLGLPICDTVMKAHGGSIEASNRTDTHGACFTIHIPKGNEPGISAQSEPNQAA